MFHLKRTLAHFVEYPDACRHIPADSHGFIPAVHAQGYYVSKRRPVLDPDAYIRCKAYFQKLADKLGALIRNPGHRKSIAAFTLRKPASIILYSCIHRVAVR